MAPNSLRRVFDQDPLLLEKDSQKDYGRAILEDLLVTRTIGTCLPTYTDLHSDASRLKFSRKRYQPAAPPEELRREYLEKRISREPIASDDVRKLHKITMTCDTAATRLRKTPVFAQHGTAAAALRKDGARSTIESRLRIAAVGFRVKISRLVGDGYLDEDLCVLRELDPDAIEGLPDSKEVTQLGRTTRLSAKTDTRWEDTISGHIAYAIEQGSHIVLLPEFALPPADLDTPLVIETRLQAASCRKRPGQDHFVFAGTRHEGMYNRGLVFTQDEDKDAPCEPWWHYKVASAKGLGENILGPHGDVFPHYSVTVTRPDGSEVDVDLIVAICYDTFDPTMFLNLVLRSALQNRNFSQRIILVPSFNPSSMFVELLRDLSFLAECPVVYVNGLHGDAKMFICGFAVSDLRDQKGESFLSELKQRIDRIDQSLLDENRKYLAACARDKFHMRTVAERSWVESSRYEIEQLKTLRNNLQNLQNVRGLDHVITVGGCQACSDGTHTDDYHCGNDILCYNIDLDLVNALTLFRRAYFRDDAFLPEPFREAELVSAATRMEDVIKKRAANDQ